MAFVSSVPLSVADEDVTLVAGAVVIVASARVARRVSIASIEHSRPVGDAVELRRVHVSPRRAIGHARASMPDAPLPFERRLGAFPLGDGHAGFRVWAPAPERVTLRAGGGEHPLDPVGFGVHEAVVEAEPGTDYEYLLDGVALPDPCSRWQPHGLRGPSRLLDTGAFTWTDADWSPPAVGDLVLYELHVGTFTPEGTFAAAIEHLRGLRELGV